MDEEFRFHLEMEVESNIRRGMSPREARRQALIAFGGVDRFRERGRDARGGRWLEDLTRDLRQATRRLRAAPTFTTAAVLVFGLGLGAVGLMFSILDTVALEPLPYPEPDELVWVWAENAAGSRNSLAYLDYEDYRAGAPAFGSLATYMRFRQTRVLTGGEEPLQVVTYRVSSNLFSTLGVLPAMGRSFLPEEEVGGQANVVILSHAFWQGRLGEDPGILGDILLLDGEPVEVAGVMPPGFEFPDGADAWLPLERDAGYAQGRGENNFFIVGRLGRGATIQQAQAQMEVIAGNIAAAYPDVMAGWRVHLVSLHDRFFGTARESILILTAIVSLVPLVACANLASLFLARAVARRTELAARLALGASRGRIVWQLLAESLVVASGGAVLGLGLAYTGAAVLRSLAPGILPRLGDVGIDGTVMVVTLLVAALLVPAFGLLPARRGTDLDVGEVLRGGTGRRATRQEWGFRSGLVVAQVALSLMLLLGSGLLFQSLLNLQATPPGVAVENVLTFQALLPAFKYDDPEESEQAWLEIESRVLALPGVAAVGFSDRGPLSGGGPGNTVYPADRPPASAADAMSATRRFVSPGYFRALQIPVVAGRLLETTDRFGEAAGVVINETLARQFFPGEDPLGRTLVLEWTSPMSLEVVGVVADVREGGLGLPPPAIFYLPARWDYEMLDVVVRAQADPRALATPIVRVTQQVESDAFVSGIRTMEELLAGMLFEARFRSAVVGAFALSALLLSLVGLYGLLNYYVQQRSHELGIRLALGAGRGGVTAQVLKKGMGLVGLGIGFGLAGGVAGGRVVRSLLFGVETTDPGTLVGVSLAVALVGSAACVLPALRANRMDPAEALRAE
jgi:predicted permease